MNQSCFTLGFFSQNSFWKLSFICGYKGYLYWVRRECETSGFSKQGWLATWLRDLIESRDNRMASCLILSCSAPTSMTVHLLACLARVLHLAACSRESPTRSSRESLFSCTLLSKQHSISLTTLTTKPTLTQGY